jgi:hypothetical protein
MRARLYPLGFRFSGASAHTRRPTRRRRTDVPLTAHLTAHCTRRAHDQAGCNSRSDQIGTNAKTAPDAPAPPMRDADGRPPTASPSTANGHTPNAKHISYMAQCVAVQYRWLMQKGHGRAVRHARVGIDRRRTRAQVVQPPCTIGAVACREAQTRACRRFVPIASCCGTHANPDDSAHGDTCGACARRRT